MLSRTHIAPPPLQRPQPALLPARLPSPRRQAPSDATRSRLAIKKSTFCRSSQPVRQPGGARDTPSPPRSPARGGLTSACKSPQDDGPAPSAAPAAAAAGAGAGAALSALKNTTPIDRTRNQARLVFSQFDTDSDGEGGAEGRQPR
jgi:hypothetical protein